MCEGNKAQWVVRQQGGLLRSSEPETGPGDRVCVSQAIGPDGRGQSSLAVGHVTVTQRACGLCSATLPLCAQLRDANSAQISEEATMSENAEQKIWSTNGRN